MLHIEVDDLSRPPVLALLEEHLREMYESSPPGTVFALDLDELRGPDVTFWTAWQDETLLGCAALKEISPSQGEIKSMRTPGALRRTGTGRALLNHIIEEARSRGYLALYLETGNSPLFQPARQLYSNAGFMECGPFGSYRENGHSYFMSMQLDA